MAQTAVYMAPRIIANVASLGAPQPATTNGAKVRVAPDRADQHIPVGRVGGTFGLFGTDTVYAIIPEL